MTEPTPQEKYRQKLAALQRDYLARLLQRAADVRSLWLRLGHHPDDMNAARELHAIAHKMAGGGGTFGYPMITHVAHSLELAMEPVLAAGALGHEALRSIDSLVLLLESTIAHESGSRLGLTEDTNLGGGTGSLTVWILEDDQDYANWLINLLGSHGYQTRHFAHSDNMEAALTTTHPDMLILDMVLPEGAVSGGELLMRLRERHANLPPAIVLSTRDDIEARLIAVRAGAAHYFVKPVGPTRLFAALDDLVVRENPAPHCFIVYGSNAVTTGRYAAALTALGARVEHITRMDLLLGAIQRHAPECLVIEVAENDATSGHELVLALKQETAFHRTAILCITPSSDVRHYEAVLLAGVDDILPAPITPEKLAWIAMMRARRARGAMQSATRHHELVTLIEHQRLALDEHAIVSIADAAGTITYVNDKFCQISGYARTELLGQNHRLLKSGEHPQSFYDEMWASISSGNRWQGLICNRSKGGGYYWVHSTIVPFLDRQGLPYQYISIRTDVTRLVAMEEALRDSEKRLLLSQEYADIGSWEWDTGTHAIIWSDSALRLLGLGGQTAHPTYADFMRGVHADDRQPMLAAVQRTLAEGKKFEIEYRYIGQDGTIRWLLDRGDVVRDANGAPVRMLGIVQDITERKQDEILLDILHHATTQFVETADPRQTADFLLNSLIDLTHSEYGFMGEVLRDDNGEPYLKTYAITNIAWNDETRRFYDENAVKGFEFRNLNTLFGHAMRTGEPVIANNPANDPRRGGFPHGHPPLHAFLGMPIFHGKELIGLYGISNRSGGYDKALLRLLEPFNATCGVLINGMRDMREREYAAQELLAAKTEAERASRAKSEFLSNMSHELRTPLNAILGFTQLLELDAASHLDAEQRDSLHEIHRAGDHLLGLINEILDLARIEAGRIQISVEAVNPRQIIHEAIALLTPLAEARQIQIVSTADSGSLPVLADRTRLKQVLINLISNGIKYNRAHGHVSVACTLTPEDKIRFDITDTGHGIPQDRQTSLFQPFERIGAEHKAIEGTGIGLAITRRLVELMDGRIGFESREGSGSLFWFELPFARSAATAAATDQSMADETAQATPVAGKILYIEDNPANLKLVEQILFRRPGIQLLSAPTAELGIELAIAHRPDLVLMDINLPGMDGFEAFGRLRQHPVTAVIPVVALSANAMPRDIERGLTAGFLRYIAKPVKVTELLDAIDAFVPTGH